MKNYSVVLFLLMAGICTGQNLTKTDVAFVKLRNTGAIFQNGNVKGYYYFYNLEKKDRKLNNYLLSVVDENLREVNSVTIIRPKSYALIESSFNGSSFLFLFFDSKAKTTELISYNNALVQTGSVVDKILNQSGYQDFNQIALGNEATQRYLLPIENQGFIYYSITGTDSENFVIKYFSNELKREWAHASVAGKKEANVESASEAFTTDNYVGSIVFKAKSASSKGYSYDLLVNDLATGQVLFRVPMSNKQFNITPSEVVYDSALHQIVIFGEYYDKADKQSKAQSLGFGFIFLDTQGNQLDFKKSSWADISQRAPVTKEGKFDGLNSNILFHEFIRTADGQLFAIGEQYKKVASASGIGLQALGVLAAVASGGGRFVGTNTASVQMNVYNMVVFQFNPENTLEKVHLFEKSTNQILLPGGSTYMSPKRLSFYVKAIGGFDYRFTQQFLGKENFAVVYVDIERSSKKGLIGSIVYTPEKVFTVDKLKFDKRSQEFLLMPAKPGYILVAEYFKKEKTFDMRLEKINY